MMINGENIFGHRVACSRRVHVTRDQSFPLPAQKFQKHSAQMAQNGSANAAAEASSSSLPTVVGINYGNSYASIAVVSKVGTFLH